MKLAATAAVTVFIVRALGVDASSLRSLDLSAWELNWLPLVGSVLALALGYVVSAALWGRMVHEFGGPRLPARETVPLFLVANLGRYIPGKVFQIAGLALLARERGVPGATAAGAAVVGQGVALMGATLVGATALLSPVLEPGLRRIGLVAVFLTWVVAGLVSIPAVARRLEALVARLSSGRATPALHRAFGLRWTALYAANWGLYATAFWFLFLGTVGFQPFLVVAPAFAAAYVGGYLALFAPAGVGIREGLLVALLSPVMAPEPALALAVLARLWTTLVEVIPAAVMAPGVLNGGQER